MLKSTLKFIRNVILLFLLWLGWPSSVFHSDAINGPHVEIKADYTGTDFSEYIYDENGNPILKSKSRQEIDSLVYGIL